MKLLFDATELTYYNENSGHKAGVFYVALNLLNEFKRMGVDVTLYCNFKRYCYMKHIKKFSDFELVKENSILNLFWSKLLYLTDKFPKRIKYMFIILARFYEEYFCRPNKKNIAEINKFDAYFSPFTPPSKDVEFSNFKRFRMIHDVIPILEKGLPKTPKDWYFRVYNSINNKDYYLTNSEYTKNDVLNYFPFINEDHIKTTLLGANQEFYPTNEQSEINENYIFSLCTLGKRKNLVFAIENFFRFIEKHNIGNLKLVLGGGVWNKFEKELESTLDKYDRSKIILTGYIPEKELKKYYSNALCFIYPSLYEGFGLPVLEAMQCGCPVISSNRTSLPEVLGEAGILINPISDEEMVLAYEKMYFDKEFREKCVAKGLERAKSFSWQKCAKEVLYFIKSTL